LQITVTGKTLAIAYHQTFDDDDDDDDLQV
jgi:hypothetical protein